MAAIRDKCDIKLLQRSLQFTLEKLGNFTCEVCQMDASIWQSGRVVRENVTREGFCLLLTPNSKLFFVSLRPI